MAILYMIWSLVCGFGVGMLFRGINITITHKQEEKPTELKYNESLVDLLPNNVKQYYHENNGRNNF